MDFIYLDNNATTPMLPEVWEAMRPYFLESSGNPASSHGAGRRARQALNDARERIAELIDAEPNEVLFTSGATEANNLAVFGLTNAEPGDSTPGHVVTSAVEHPCVAEPVGRLIGQGFAHTRLPVSKAGVVVAGGDFVRQDTRLVAIMLANHETGAIQPVRQLAAQVAGRAPFHCDAAAAAGKIPISFRKLDVTSLTLSAHKFHGPTGIGALVIKNHARLRPLFWGGHQQSGKRPGTESVPLAVGMATALELATRDMEANRANVLRLRELFLERLRARAAPVVLNGPAEGGIPHTINLSFPGCAADLLLMSLDLAGIGCSTGSACSSGSLLPSPVLLAMGVAEENLRSAMRFSLNAQLSALQVDEAVHRIANVVIGLRQNKENAG